ncbi:hypothetical protein [Falsiroseomonas sp.]|uniref:hypothetical protein n=1 Tax=Falsiroseomonas sp. TaxID=2870721 RepID=UPI00273735FE|nr:hypothetical protein [Falsiroseomonas sp.]MDP3416772.1 hypothetical protein [Falsiroseomonas sp.]
MSTSDGPAPGRRLLILRVTTLGLTALPLAAQAQEPKSGAGGTAPGGKGGAPPQRSGLTDSDPSDDVGNGRGGNRPPAGVTDRDPGDQPGRGRGGNRAAGPSDSDPNDPPGRGRGGNRAPAGPSDNDPSDPPGRGRGAAPPTKRT